MFDEYRRFVLFWKVQFEILIFCTERTLTAALSLCPHEMKASELTYSSVMPEKKKPAGHEHTILLVTSGREEGLPSRVREGWG